MGEAHCTKQCGIATWQEPQGEADCPCQGATDMKRARESAVYYSAPASFLQNQAKTPSLKGWEVPPQVIK